MSLPRGSQPVPGWTIQFPVKAAQNADTYRIADDSGKLSFLKVFHPGKTLPDGFTSDGRLLEIAIMESLDHPSIPPVRQSGNLADGRPYFIADLVPGETLDHRLARVFAVSPEAAASIMRGLCKAVSYLHELPDHVTHGELTPSNVLLDPGEHDDDRPVLIDFGHARRKSDGPPVQLSAVDPHYLPSECFEAPVASRTADVFALAAIYFRLLMSKPPWHAEHSSPRHVDLRETLLRARTEPLKLPVRADGGHPDAATLTVITKALSHRPEDRFPDAGSLLDALSDRTGPVATVSAIPGRQRPPTPVTSVRGFAAVAGMNELKRTLLHEVIEPLRDPERARRLGIKPEGMLLWGPPGCGKTFIAKRLGEEADLAFRSVVPSDVASPYVHGTQELIGKLFDEARQNAPCVLFLDEVDALIPSREGTLQASYAGEVNEWLAQMNDCAEQGVFLLAATNEPSRLDTAVRRSGRFGKTTYVGPPDFEARKAMFAIHLRGRAAASDLDCDELAQMTGGRVASDISFLVDEAARTAFANRDESICMEHVVAAIRRNGPSVSAEQLARYDKMRERLSPSGRPRIGFQ